MTLALESLYWVLRLFPEKEVKATEPHPEMGAGRTGSFKRYAKIFSHI